MIEKQIKTISDRLKSLAQNKDLNQSILLTGPVGVGKFQLVMDIARFMLCRENMGCGTCLDCRNIGKLQHPDFLFVFPFPKIRPESRKHTLFSFSDPISSSAKYSQETKDEVDNYISIRLKDPYAIVDFEKKENIPVEIIKDILNALSKKPLMGGRRVVAIQDIDKMAFGAADLFLKIVEEPPSDTHIVLTTSNPGQLPPTLLSRTNIVKVPPFPIDDLSNYLCEKLEVDTGEAEFLARMSKGSRGKAIYLYENRLIERRNKILAFFDQLIKQENIPLLIERVSVEYVDNRFRINDIRLDFEIMEAIIHDLYILNENQLEKHLVNVDIAEKLKGLNRPAIETLDIWKGYCGETKRACLVNNVAVSSAMFFFYISCGKAIDNPVTGDLRLP